MNSADLKLYLVTDRRLALGRSLEEVVEEAIKGGVTLVQLREKEASANEFYHLAMRLKKLLTPRRIPLIINDRLDIALACDAEGIHIGQNDLPFPIVRRLLGNDKIIGLSVESLQDAEEANMWDADYIAVSPVFGTPTKTDTAPALGSDGLRQIASISRHPVIGIGGINLINTPEVIASGASGVAIVSAIMSAADPREAACRFREVIDQSGK